MANEPTTTITCNLTADPELRYTPTGRQVAAFTIANTPRFPDKSTGQWQDGETWFVRCSAWGDMAENITTSLSKGNAVVATGRLRCRTWETDQGDKRSVVEMTVDDLGPSLRRAVVKVTKATREHAPTADTSPAPAIADQWNTPAEPVPAAAVGGPADDNPPF
ncbi:MAG: single-stranded DNA-binding protein [Streptosporangiaceae bacterium]